jgi:hypothetical protein
MEHINHLSFQLFNYHNPINQDKKANLEEVFNYFILGWQDDELEAE